MLFATYGVEVYLEIYFKVAGEFEFIETSPGFALFQKPLFKVTDRFMTSKKIVKLMKVCYERFDFTKKKFMILSALKKQRKVNQKSINLQGIINRFTAKISKI